VSTILSTLRSRRDARLRDDETGFSLIELMIVLLIIAILLAVAIPTYLAARDRAENRAAQETIAHTFVAAKADYASQNSFSPTGGATSMAAYLTSQDPGVTVTSASAKDATGVSAINTVSETHGAQSLALAAYAPDGNCYYLLDIESSTSAKLTTSGVSGPGTYYGTTTGQTSCTAAFAAPASGWDATWAAASAATPAAKSKTT